MRLTTPPTGRSNGTEYFSQLTRARRWIGRGLLFTAFVLLSIQLIFNKHTLEKAKELAEPDALYDMFATDKAEYHPGDIIHFTFTRTTRLKTGAYPLLLLSIDSFENLDTGELFPAATNARIITESGMENVKATRKIPDYATPGNYIFIGWSSSQTTRQTAASYYFSNQFIIKP